MMFEMFVLAISISKNFHFYKKKKIIEKQYKRNMQIQKYISHQRGQYPNDVIVVT